MNYKCIELENCNLYMVKTDKFKTIDFRIFFYHEINKEEVTWLNCLTEVLLYATKKYPTKKEVAIKTCDLYSLIIENQNLRLGNYYVTKLAMSILNPKYTEKGMLEESIDFLYEVLFNPLVSNGSFKKEYLEIVKNELKAESETIKENPRAYSNIRLLEETDKNEAFAINSYCDPKILDEINEHNLYEYYQKIINDNKVFITVSGDINEKEITKYIEKKLPFNNKRVIKKPIVIEHNAYRKRIKKVVEDANYNQSKLAISIKTKDLTTFEYRYVLNIYNAILGGGSGNKLMKIVREENSLAYYVNSHISKADNLIMINSGIDARNYDKAVRLIKKIMKSIEEGNITDDELESSKMEYISSFDAALENADGIHDIILGQILFDSEDVETRKKEILKVTKKDIINLAQKIHLDTIFLLRGAGNE